jgi:hypothetical protein
MAAPFKLVKGKEQKMIVTSSKARHKSQPLDLFGSSLVTSNQLPQAVGVKCNAIRDGTIWCCCACLPPSAKKS